MRLRSLVLAVLLVAGASCEAAAQYEFMPEGAKTPPPKAKRAKPAAAKAAPPPAPSPAQAAPATKVATPPPAPAKIAAPADDKPMQVALVRSAEPGCEPNCPEWIAAQGRIEANSLARFKAALKKAGDRKPMVLIDSSGGSVDAALAIGRLIRAKGLDISVTKTELAPCAPAGPACKKIASLGIKFGTPKALFAKCASACAFVLAGGVRRFVSPRTYVGVHQFTVSETRVLRTYRVEPQPFWSSAKPKKVLVSEKVLSTSTKEAAANHKSYANVRKYFAEMGIGGHIMALVISAPSSSIRILTPAELGETKLATESVDAEELITGLARTETLKIPSQLTYEDVPEGAEYKEPPPLGVPGAGLGLVPVAPGSPAGPVETGSVPAPELPGWKPFVP